jgi:hypothetical protein
MSSGESRAKGPERAGHLRQRECVQFRRLVQYRSSSPFVVFTGDDLFMVLDGRIGLDDLLRAKKRHVNETGNCHLPARSLLVSSD